MQNKTLNILLIEDNVSTALDMEMKLTEMGHSVIATVDRGDKALNYISDSNLDMAIIDIGLRGAIDGVQVAEQFRKFLIPIIFSTARQDTDTFERAQAVSPLAYLVKPFDKLTLQSCLDQAIRLKAKKAEEKAEEPVVQTNDFFKDYFFIRSKGSLHKIKFGDIDYIQSDRNYSMIHVNGRKFAAKISLNNLIQKLPINKFVRVHQSYIVSFSKVDKINVNEETISIADVTLPMGKTYKSTLMKRINRI